MTFLFKYPNFLLTFLLPLSRSYSQTKKQTKMRPETSSFWSTQSHAAAQVLSILQHFLMSYCAQILFPYIKVMKRSDFVTFTLVCSRQISPYALRVSLFFLLLCTLGVWKMSPARSDGRVLATVTATEDSTEKHSTEKPLFLVLHLQCTQVERKYCHLSSSLPRHPPEGSFHGKNWGCHK